MDDVSKLDHAAVERQCREAYDRECPDFRGDYRSFRNGYYAALNTGHEPVAIVRVHRTGGNPGIAWSAVPTDNAPLMRDGDVLYLLPAVIVRSPLTAAYIETAFDAYTAESERTKSFASFVAGVRRCERAHGISESGTVL